MSHFRQTVVYKKMIKYLNELKKLGFRRRSILIHDDDYPEIKKITKKLREDRLQGRGETLELDLENTEKVNEN